MLAFKHSFSTTIDWVNMAMLREIIKAIELYKQFAWGENANIHEVIHKRTQLFLFTVFRGAVYIFNTPDMSTLATASG